MVDQNKDQESVPESERTAREVYLDEKEKREAENRLRREQQQKDQSLREGLVFLFRSLVQFVSYVAIGVFIIFFSQDLVSTHQPMGIILVLLGIGLIIKGMLSLGGFNVK